MFEKGSSLKDQVFGKVFFQHFAAIAKEVIPQLDEQAFYALCVQDLEALSLSERMTQGAKVLGAHLTNDFEENIYIIKKIAPKLQQGFAGIILPEYIKQEGILHLEQSMYALKYLTPFSSSELAVRPFIVKYKEKVFEMLYEWAEDPNEHVRRWCSEGTRSRLPWAMRLEVCVEQPDLSIPILEKLKADNSLYVRKSVANHLNDQTKDKPVWVLELLSQWDQGNKHTAWITKRALRTLIKQGHPQTFGLLGYEKCPQIQVKDFSITKEIIKLGEYQSFSFSVSSEKDIVQKLVIDYKLYYLKANGKLSPKVFKLKEVELKEKEQITIQKKHSFQDFTTRKHYAGKHQLAIMINGEEYAKGVFELSL